RICRLKGEHQVAKVNLVPSKIMLQRSLQDAEELAVHVIFGDAQQKKGADDPANITGSSGHALGRGCISRQVARTIGRRLISHEIVCNPNSGSAQYCYKPVVWVG